MKCTTITFEIDTLIPNILISIQLYYSQKPQIAKAAEKKTL